MKGLCGRCFIFLRPPPLLGPHTPPPLTHCIGVYSYSILIHTWKRGGGGELTREKVRGAMVHKAGRKYQYD
jgi:hypothetical protein